jgi:hypothetical protein
LWLVLFSQVGSQFYYLVVQPQKRGRARKILGSSST